MVTDYLPSVAPFERVQGATGQFGAQDPDVRFWRKVEVVTETGCWIWLGSTTLNGYGSFWAGKRLSSAHRWAYERFRGPIPPNRHLDHLCRTPPCVNPDHLEPVTFQENVLRGFSPNALNARKTRCKRDHELSGANLHIDVRGHRKCRTCDMERLRRRRLAMRLRRRSIRAIRQRLNQCISISDGDVSVGLKELRTELGLFLDREFGSSFNSGSWEDRRFTRAARTQRIEAEK
jgi:hypothetical protein